MKKFLKDDTRKAQTLSEEAIRGIFKIEEYTLETATKEKFVVIHNYRTEKYSVQIAFNIANKNANNDYLVLVFDDDDNLISCFGFESTTKYPPVWNREFGNIDYADFLGIQKRINDNLAFHDLETMDYDLSVKGKSFYYCLETPEVLNELVLKNEPYSIVAIFGEKATEDMVMSAKQKAGFNIN